MKKAVVFAVLMLLLCTNVYAEDVYGSAYNSSGLSEIAENIDESTRDVLEELGIDIADYTTFFNTDINSFFTVFKKFFTDGIKTPIKAFLLSCGMLVLGAVINGVWTDKFKLGESYNFVLLLSLTTAVLVPLFATFSATVTALKGVSGFMLAFVPVFAGVLVTSGAVGTGSAFCGTMLAVCEIISQILSNFVTPIIGMYSVLGVSVCVSGLGGAEVLAQKFKSVANWIMGLLTTLFTGFLSIQTAVAKASDNLSLKTAKFFVGSFVPVAGNALSEALNTVIAGAGVLKYTAFSWCIIVIGIAVLPFVIEIVVWKMLLSLLSVISGVFGNGEAQKLFEVCAGALGFLMGITLFVCTLFILSVITVKIGGGG